MLFFSNSWRLPSSFLSAGFPLSSVLREQQDVSFSYEFGAPVTAALYGEDGDHILYGLETGEVGELRRAFKGAALAERSTLAKLGEPIASLKVSPDGGAILAVTKDGKVALISSRPDEQPARGAPDRSYPSKHA